MDFEIGNGLIFPKKDVIEAIKKLDPDYKAEVIYELMYSLWDSFKQEEDTIKVIKSEETIKYVNKIVTIIMKNLESEKSPSDIKIS